MLNKAVNYLRKKFTDNNWQPITVTMKCNNDQLTITPCMPYIDENLSLTESMVEFYLIDSSLDVYMVGTETLEALAKKLIEYEEFLVQRTKSINWLKAYVRANEKDWRMADRGFFSDVFKDQYGRRPHISIDRLITWANSETLECPVPAC